MSHGPPKWPHGLDSVVLDLIPSGVFLLDPDLQVVDHNEAFEQTFGSSKGRTCFEIFYHTAAPCPDCPVARASARDKDCTAEVAARDAHGREVQTLVRLRPVEVEGQRFVAGVSTDLSAIKRLQKEYRTLFEKVPCYVTVINTDFRVVRANEAFRDVFGEARGECCYELFKDQKTPCRSCPAKKTFADGKTHTSTQVGLSRSGKTTHYVVSTAPLRGQSGQTTHVVEMALDVTELRELEQELSKAHLMREALVENSLDAIVLLDASERVVLFNHAAEKLWGYSLEEIKGRQPPEGMIPGALHQVMAAPLEVPQELSITTKGGQSVPVRMAAVPLKESGHLLGVAITAKDLRTIKELERAHLEAERLAAVGQTVAGLAHGIKNILTGLEGGMYVTSSGLERGDSERLVHGWSMLERNMKRISTLTKNLLAFSRGDEPEVAWIDPLAVVRDVVDLFEDSATKQGITIHLDENPAVAPAPMDREGLHCAVSNLLSNALDACSMSQNAAPCIQLDVTEAEETIRVAVHDSGCGMDYEVKQTVFSNFFYTKGAEGTGLGLLLTRKIVQQHGGAVTFESAPGKGTTFCLSFPRHRLPRPMATGVSGEGEGKRG